MLQKLRNNDERGVSPVIGVILMVAITVILAAVIASFVLGLGDADDPAPQPTVDTDFSSDELEVSISGGDDFDGSVTEMQADVTVEVEGPEDENGGTATNTDEIEDLSIDLVEDAEDTEDVSDGDEDFAEDVEGDVVLSVDTDADDEVTAGDTITVDFEVDDEENDYAITDWDLEAVWDPADQDSEVIISQSGSN